MALDNLILKYRKELHERLGNYWDIYANDVDHAVISYIVSYANPKNEENSSFWGEVKNMIKKLNPNYTDSVEIKHFESTVLSIDIKNNQFYFNPESKNFFAGTLATLLEIAKRFVDDCNEDKNKKHDKDIEDDCLDMWAANNKNIMVCFTLNNFKKENDNLVSFDISCDGKYIFKHVKWNGKSLKTLKVILLDKLTNMNDDDNNVDNIKNALFFCKLMSNNHFYLRVKSVAQKVLSEDYYYQCL